MGGFARKWKNIIMKISIYPENGKVENSFTFGKIFYELCKASDIDVETVAKMMLLEAENENNKKKTINIDN